jgi:hypothetical protein
MSYAMNGCIKGIIGAGIMFNLSTVDALVDYRVSPPIMLVQARTGLAEIRNIMTAASTTCGSTSIPFS